MERKWLKCEEVAQACGVAVTTVWAWIRRGHLKAYRLGKRSYRIDADDLDRFITRAKN